jgi:hypothetical protein
VRGVMRSISTFSCAVLLTLTTGLFDVAARQAAPAGPADLHPQLDVVMRAGFKGNDINMGLGLDRDTWIETTLYAGRRETPEAGMCASGGMAAMAGGSAVPSEAAPLVAWTVSARLVDMDGDSATIDIRWKRQVSPHVEPATAYEGQVRGKLREGTPMVLDTARSLDGRDPACLSAALSAEFRLAGASEFSNAAIVYDAWLVQTQPLGDTRTRHMRTTGRQGEKVPFMFPLVAIAEPSTTSAGAVAADLSVAGGIRGRLRADGSIDLSVDASRFVVLRDASQSTGSTGRTHLNVRPGETVEFEPAPLEGATAGFPLTTLLADTRTAIRIRAARAW